MYVDLSYQGRLAARRSQLDNGKLPHGGYKGSKRHPPCLLSFNQGPDFHENLNKEIQRLLWEKENIPYGSSPTWSILVRNEPSFTDESLLMTKKLLSASKRGQSQTIKTPNWSTQVSIKQGEPMKINGQMYYRPNSMHQFLSATDLRNSSQNEVKIQHGRPTRTTLLRALQRQHSTSAKLYQTRRDFLHKLSDIRDSFQISLTSEYFKFKTSREGEPLHSFLTGTRYNRYNPDLGCNFTLPKEEASYQKYEDSLSRPPTPSTPELNPCFDSITSSRPSTVALHRPKQASISLGSTLSAQSSKVTPLTLSVKGNNIPVIHHKTVTEKLHNQQTIKSDFILKHFTFTENDALRIYGHSTASSCSRHDLDSQSVNESLTSDVGKSFSEPTVEAQKGRGRLWSNITRSKSGRTRTKADATCDVSVKVLSFSKKRFSFPSTTSAPVFVPSQNIDTLNLNHTDSHHGNEMCTDKDGTYDSHHEEISGQFVLKDKNIDNNANIPNLLPSDKNEEIEHRQRSNDDKNCIDPFNDSIMFNSDKIKLISDCGQTFNKNIQNIQENIDLINDNNSESSLYEEQPNEQNEDLLGEDYLDSTVENMLQTAKAAEKDFMNLSDNEENLNEYLSRGLLVNEDLADTFTELLQQEDSTNEDVKELSATEIDHKEIVVQEIKKLSDTDE